MLTSHDQRERSEMKITACLITHDEEDNLPRCIESVKKIADELVVIDSGSKDRTCEIAREAGAKVIEQEWKGYVTQKNDCIAQASHEWVFSIDADEELSPELIKEIRDLKANPPPSVIQGYSLSRIVFFRGAWIRFGDWYPDRLVRLFRKDAAGFAGGAVHERLEVQGSIASLRGELYHYTYKDEEDQLNRIDHYSTLWAETSFQKGKRSHAFTPAIRGAWRLLRAFIIKQGWKGGGLGWRIAQLNAYEVWLKYHKLNQLRKQSKTQESSA